MWLRVDTTRAAITKDLEEMHAKGIEGAFLWDSGGTALPGAPTKMVLQGKDYRVVPTQDYPSAHATPIPSPLMESWTPPARELYRFAAKEAGRLGIKLCIAVGLAGTSGPIPLEDGQQKLVWSETSVKGPQTFAGPLPAPNQDVTATFKPALAKSAFVHARKKAKTYPIHDVAVLAVPDKPEFDPSEVIDLSGKFDTSGNLQWDAPAGSWKVLRFGYTPTGMANVWGLFTDAMSAEALDKTWGSTMGQLLKEMTPDERKGMVGVEDDSWEAGPTTWTPLFASEFLRLRGYNLIPWLPVLAGKHEKDPDAVTGVKRDYYRTIADLIAKNHYAHLRELANQNGLTCFSEAAGPNSAQLDTMLDCKGVDVAMAEFWMPSPHRPTPALRFLLRNAASANHIYGKPLTGCESFTSVGNFWEESLFDLKNVADQAFCDGCNLNVIHNYSHSPSLTAKPGYVYFAGTFYNRNVTWWEQTPAFNTYLGRCCSLLQQGLFVADALYYRGDDIGHGEPMKTQPALPAEGYDHDNCNLDALLSRVSVKDGRLVLPDGMSYRILVLPDDSPLAPEALTKIASLVDGGAIVVGPKPSGMAGLPVAADVKARFDAEVARLWGSSTPQDKTSAGRIISERQPGQVLKDLNLPPDLQWQRLSKDGELDWIHRTANGADIYFIASRWDSPETISATFRVAGKQPELWNPVTGEIRDATAFHQASGRTTVPLEFDPRGSVFVIFRRPIGANIQGATSSNYPEISPSAKLDGAWNIAFDPKWGGPDKISFDSLVDWTKRPEDGIRHYSGAAVYHKTFKLTSISPTGTRLLLDLGEVHEVASVRLNGADLGVIWTKPARVDITSAAHVGENQLEVTVVNLWPNRLIADESLPPEQRLTETNMHKFSAATPLLPSGLIGPVTLETATPRP